MVEVLRPKYLKEPNVRDTEKLLATREARGFPGMFKSIDCMQELPEGLRKMY